MPEALDILTGALTAAVRFLRPALGAGIVICLIIAFVALVAFLVAIVACFCDATRSKGGNIR